MALLLGLVLTALASACDDAAPTEPAATADPAPGTAAQVGDLDEAWSLDREGETTVEEWLDEDVVVRSRPGQLIGHDLATGVVLWAHNFDDEQTVPCAASDALNADGIGGLLLEDGSQRCRTAAALDTRSGRILRQGDLGRQGLRQSGEVGVGDTTMTAVTRCGRVVRFALDGRRLPQSIRPREGRCWWSARTDGHLVATFDESGVTDAATFSLYDADTGRRLWDRAVPPQRASVDGIFATEPLALAVTEDGQQRLQLVDADGRTDAILATTSDLHTVGFRPLGRVGRVLVVGTRGPTEVQGFDVRTGRRLWRLDPGSDRFAAGGLAGGGALLVTEAEPTDDLGALTVTELDAGTGERTGVLGRVPQEFVSQWALGTRTLFTIRETMLDQDELRAYPLPRPPG